MTRVVGVGAGGLPARRLSRTGGGFALPDQPGLAGGSAVAAPAPALLALQDGAAQPAPAEPPARRAARAGLALLRDVQLDLLRGRDDPERPVRLAALVAEVEAAADPSLVPEPALRAALGELALRLKVELARCRAGSATSR
jgi:hypothetical protein